MKAKWQPIQPTKLIEGLVDLRDALFVAASQAEGDANTGISGLVRMAVYKGTGGVLPIERVSFKLEGVSLLPFGFDQAKGSNVVVKEPRKYWHGGVAINV